MFIKYGSTVNLKQFSSTLSNHILNRPFKAIVTGTLKVHGMGVGIHISHEREVNIQVHDSSVDFEGEIEYGGWRDFSKKHMDVFKTFASLVILPEDGVLCISGEFYGGKVQTTGSLAYAPKMGVYIYDVSIKTPNPDFIPTQNQNRKNSKWKKQKLNSSILKDLITDVELYIAEDVYTVSHVLGQENMSYKAMAKLFESDVAKLEQNCPFGAIVNPDGNLIAEGLVYTVHLPAMGPTEYFPAQNGFSTKFKVKGKLHKRKSGNTLTGVDNGPLNEWALESDALSNDRLQQMFDVLHKEDGFVPGLTCLFADNVMADIEKECYVFLEDEKYKNVTRYLITQSIRKPIVSWYKGAFKEAFVKELAALTELHKNKIS